MWNKLEFNSKSIINEYTKNRFSICDYSFANLYLWSFGEDTKYKIEDEILFLKSIYDNKEYYYMPIPRRETEESLEVLRSKIEELLKKQKRIFYASEYWKNKFNKYFCFEENRDYADYIYSFERLAYLKGRKYSKKRNRIKNFLKKYENYTYEKISDKNIEEVIKFQKKWDLIKNLENKEILKNESEGILAILKDYSNLDLLGGILKFEGSIIAYTIGEILNEETVVIHIEKALANYIGSYQFINMKFLQEQAFKKVKFVNREDDFGVEGLRRAKMSYHPLYLEKKYNIVSIRESMED